MQKDVGDTTSLEEIYSQRTDIRYARVLEYVALKKLCIVIWVYHIGVHLLATLALAVYFHISHAAGSILRTRGINYWWFSSFHVVSAFGNSGLSILPDNLIPFSTDRYVQLLLAAVIVLGNTGFPIGLRFLVWVFQKIAKKKDPYSYILR